jgi:hypothetical protein
MEYKYYRIKHRGGFKAGYYKVSEGICFTLFGEDDKAFWVECAHSWDWHLNAFHVYNYICEEASALEVLVLYGV